jgi:hypothetical protein
MNKRLVFKLLPVAIVAAVGIFWAASAAPPAAEAGVSAVSATAGMPSTVTVSAENGAGFLTVSANNGGTLTCNVTCTNNGTSTVGIDLGSSTVKTAATVTLTLNGTCATGGSITVTALQSSGSITTTSGQATVSCSIACTNVLLSGCCDGLNTSSLLLGNNCGCFNGLQSSSVFFNQGLGCGCFNSLTTSTLFLNNGCGCFGGVGLNNVTLGSQLGLGGIGIGSQLGLAGNCGLGVGCSNGFNNALFQSNCGCVNGFQSPGLLANCGCVGGGNVTGGLVLAGNNILNNNCTANQVSVTVPGSATCGSTTNVLVSVRNTLNGIALDGTPVVVSSTMGTVAPTQTFTSGGIASATLLIPANAAGTATVTAGAAGLTGQASIVVTCNVTPVAPAPIVQPIAFPTAPILITGPNTGDGGCFVVACN